jgi:hypothetical protein
MAPDDELIDRLTRKLNQSGRLESFPCDKVPGLLRVSADSDNYCTWQIRPIAGAPWLDDFERELFRPLPPVFRSLVRRYGFLEFELGPLLMCENTGEDRYYELISYTRRDRGLQEELVPAGYIHFARETSGGYDPICFDTNRGQDGDYPIVQIDHEDILINRTITVIDDLAPSFRSVVESYLSAR